MIENSGLYRLATKAGDHATYLMHNMTYEEKLIYLDLLIDHLKDVEHNIRYYQKPEAEVI